MENLLVLLNKISQLSPLGVFNQEVIIVQNPGMQHWLNLAIAQERGISMNMGYALPSQFLWKLIRTLAGDENVLDQSPYSREVLTWRIYGLLGSEIITNDDDFSQANQYWQGDHSAELKRYQLAVQLADLYEQYLIFRPTWLDDWQQGSVQSHQQDFGAVPPTELQWQAKLWRLLVAEVPYNPVELLNGAVANIDEKIRQTPDLLPKRISFFAINTMPPIWLTFLNALSEHVEIDFYHLNPCFAYWGDIISEKQAIKKLSHWSADVSDDSIYVGNPLLANLGQQGREFLSLLQDYSTVNVELFVAAGEQLSANENCNNDISILHQIQNDILHLEDATATNANNEPDKKSIMIDDSISIVSCHSALREVQALHDYLLHQFNRSNLANNNDKHHQPLTPKDVLVMCPQIESYAPYVNAVFTRGWQQLADEVPPLPCSIADRSAQDSDPLIAAFSELLSLPDSRFQVSQLIAFLRQNAVANKFAIANEDIDKISAWLQQASIHWGLDSAHKQAIIGDEANNNFTWQQGLSRLLRGFAFADSEVVYQKQMLLANVEGDDALLLGQLMLLIEQLQQFSMQLSQARTPQAWQSFLLAQLESLFATSNDASLMNTHIENSMAIIEGAIASLVEYCHHGGIDEKIELSIVTEFLQQHFSQGDASRQFMVGQVTFCSMLPMRSIPFKIIAVLGLNDGEFPRQRQPLGFDLLAKSSAKLGDRSLRGDDRYLFLEAIISARTSLYLSYQGRSIKNNTEKQPSLVLAEFMDYLSQGYGWNFDDDQPGDKNSKQIPMQPFSTNNYDAITADVTDKQVHHIGNANSFDPHWLAHAIGKGSQDQTPLLAIDSNPVEKISTDDGSQVEEITISAAQLSRFFQHPSKYFAQQALNLYLEDNRVSLDDVEPFAPDHLETYLLKQALLAAHLHTDDAPDLEQALQRATFSGKFPDLPTMASHYEEWQSDSEQLANEILSQGLENPELVDCHVIVKVSPTLTVKLTAQLPIKKNGTSETDANLVYYRSSTAKAKDLFVLYLNHLIVTLWQQQNALNTASSEGLAVETSKNNLLIDGATNSLGFYFNTKAQKVEQYTVKQTSAVAEPLTANSDLAHQQLQLFIHYYFKGLQQPLLVNGNIATQVFKKSRGKPVSMTQTSFEQFWCGNDNIPGLSADPYINYFWPQCPEFIDYKADIDSIYHDLYQHVINVSGDK